MDYGDGTRYKRDHDPTARAYAANGEYAAYAGSNGIFVRKLSEEQSRTRTIKFGTKRPHHEAVLAFHPARLNLLAASIVSQLVVFDVETSAAKHVLKGNGRIITSVSFAQSDHDKVATGTADGSICVWSIKETSRPLHLLRGPRNACSRVCIHPNHAEFIAATHANQVSLWRIPHRRPIISAKINPGNLQLLDWCSEAANQLLTVSHGGIVSIYDLGSATSGSASLGSNVSNYGSDDEEVLSSRSEQGVSCTAFNLASGMRQAQILGHDGLILLPSTGKDLYFYSFSMSDRNMTELWRLHKEMLIDCFALRRNGNSIEVLIVSETATETYRVPFPVLDSMGWSSELPQALSHIESETIYKKGSNKFAYGSMRPQKKLRIANIPSHTYDSRQKSRVSRGAREARVKPKARKPYQDPSSRPRTSGSQSMTSSLELPKERPDEDDRDSPMPFLSPNIPARKTSPGLITPLDESMQLPPLALADSSSPAMEEVHDSDSDDDTFAGDMKSSGTFLPGGVNVPLPRSCGALFGPNGRLITFFPYRIKKAPLENHVSTKGSATPGTHGDEVNKLFPGFGNLSTLSYSRAFSSGSGSSASDDEHSHAPRFVVQSSSFDGKSSWVPRISPIKPTMGSLPGENRVTVSVRDMESLTPTRQVLADTYELLSDELHSTSDLCRENATRAAKQGLELTAGAWRLLAIILEPTLINTADINSYGDISAIFPSKRPELSRNTSKASSHYESIRMTADLYPLLHLPLGRVWAAEQLFEWAEGRADVQLLACMSTLLSRTYETLTASAKRPRHRRSSNIYSDLMISTGSIAHHSVLPPDLPALYTEDISTRTTDSSPNKTYQSRLSSGNPSQPTTPFLDSSNSTPPFALSTVARQNTKLSISGSASPEHHRSSFGAAAKNYAASIAEKFGSYGSSSPTRKLGTSPGNELSSSLPNATGSWSKSVSFASTLDPSKNSQRSLSLAQEDDNYDSDRTVEENSATQTPRRPSSGVAVNKMKGSFFDEKSTQPTLQSVSEELAARGSLWRQTYAEQLRSWDMLIEAAEMVNVASTGPMQSDLQPKQVTPEVASGRQCNDCSICYCIVQAAEQVCPACLHITHPTCLDELISTLGVTDFTCPTGCGCNCTSAMDVSFALDDLATEEEDADHQPPLKKRPSLTDPLRLRQRLQGESW